MNFNITQSSCFHTAENQKPTDSLPIPAAVCSKHPPHRLRLQGISKVLELFGKIYLKTRPAAICTPHVTQKNS
ncbi:MAG TPA: hypothetical protein DC058_11090 [Planctomycetaceae bacterium]|nr:hypothetical protein [Planctomycetaceae bacterium]